MARTKGQTQNRTREKTREVAGEAAPSRGGETAGAQAAGGQGGGAEELRKNGMMAHLMDALSAGQDVGHYGRLTFAMIARHFLNDEELVTLLTRGPAFTEEQARALVEQVRGRDYNPPRRERILEWQKEQEFPICPTDNPDACNVYRDLTFPDGIYDHIQQYHEQKAHAQTPPTQESRGEDRGAVRE